jgi:predicted permease
MEILANTSLAQDLKFSVRRFRRHPLFVVTVVLTLALGIGAATAIFSVVNGVLLRPLPFQASEQLMTLVTLEYPPGVTPTNAGAANQIGSSYPNFFDWQTQNQTFTSLASWNLVPRLFSKVNGEGARVLVAARVSANLFSTLRIAPVLGRTFLPEEEQAGHRVVILSYEMWVSDFTSSANVIGQVVRISDEPSTIVGVMPRGFHFPVAEPAYFWTTFSADREGSFPVAALRSWDALSVLGRLKSGVTPAQASADVNTIQGGLARHYKENQYRPAVSVLPLLNEATDQVRPALLSLLAAVFLLVLIGCCNVAGLLLARSNGRRAEVAVRIALGARRARIIREWLTETLLLSSMAGVTGIVLGFVLLRLTLRLLPVDLPRLYAVSVDARVLGFAILLSVVTALISGVLPAWRTSNSDPADALRGGSPFATGGRRRTSMHQTLVVAETALSLSLLVGAGLLIRSMINVLAIDPGFDTRHTLAFDTALTNQRYPDPSKVLFFDKALPRLAGLPGVENVSAGHPVPFNSSSWGNFTIPGHLDPPDHLPGAAAVAEPGYFETLSIPLIRGRLFTAHDNELKAARVAIINKSFAEQYFPGEDPIGHYLIPRSRNPKDNPEGCEIVGIVGDTRTEDAWNPYQPQFYLPYAQDPTHQRPIIVMKVAGEPSSYENEVRSVIASIDPDVPVFRFRTFNDDIDRQASQPRFQAVLVSLFGGLALLLSAVGLYAFLSYIVAERTRELGIRMALGASRSGVLRLVLRRGLWLSSIGVWFGGMISAVAARLLSDSLFRVRPMDASVFLTVVLVLMIVSLVSAMIPASRAAKLDPIRSLREQ